MKLSAKQLTQILVSACENKSGDELQEIIKGFVSLLAERQELFRVREVIRTIDQVWKEKYGAANLEVESAYPLSSDIRDKLQKLAKGASIKETTNKDLLGGMRIRIDDTMIDGSVAGKLMALRRTLSQ